MSPFDPSYQCGHFEDNHVHTTKITKIPNTKKCKQNQFSKITKSYSPAVSTLLTTLLRRIGDKLHVLVV